VLNVEKIIIGGEMMVGDKTVLDAIVGKAKELSFKPSFAATQILVGKLGENAPAIGVALLSNSL
jgi:hypothetical protein